MLVKWSKGVSQNSDGTEGFMRIGEYFCHFATPFRCALYLLTTFAQSNQILFALLLNVKRWSM